MVSGTAHDPINEAGPPPASQSMTIQIDPPPGVDRASDQNPIFSISEEPKMPVIRMRARVVNASGPDPTADTDFAWSASVAFDSSKCPNGTTKNGSFRKITALTISGACHGGEIVVDFSPTGRIRGGDLKITVSATVQGTVMSAETKGWRIQGTNPSRSTIGAALPDDTHRKIACAESSMRQFVRAPADGGAWYPYFSSDRLLGVGICQLTRPTPTDDQVWNWKENVNAGIKLYKQKRGVARRYPSLVAKSSKFLALVNKYNNWRKASDAPIAAGLTAAPVTVTVPEFSADQLEDDTIRGFNGWAGRDAFGNVLHEFRIQVDDNRNLVVSGDSASGVVAACWERVPVADRPGAGDPHYIDSVKKRDPQTCARLK
jgi:hypothetical protein